MRLKKYNYKDKDSIGKVKVLLGDEVIYEDNLYVKLEKKNYSLATYKKWFNGK